MLSGLMRKDGSRRSPLVYGVSMLSSSISGPQNDFGSGGIVGAVGDGAAQGSSRGVREGLREVTELVLDEYGTDFGDVSVHREVDGYGLLALFGHENDCWGAIFVGSLVEVSYEGECVAVAKRHLVFDFGGLTSAHCSLLVVFLAVCHL